MGFKKINHLSICILLILAFSLSCGVKVRIYTKRNAIEYISSVSDGWKLDSNGTLGYRDKIYYHLKWTPYNFKNVDWNKIKDNMGRPNEKGRSYVKNAKASYLDSYVYYIKVIFDGNKYKRINGIAIEVNPINNKIIRIKKIEYD